MSSVFKRSFGAIFSELVSASMLVMPGVAIGVAAGTFDGAAAADSIFRVAFSMFAL